MGEIVNLRGAKKQRTRAAAAAQAQQNRVLHGRTKGEKARDALERAQREAAQANAALDRPETTPND